ncbi:hypothetical protein D6833_11970 [Candidatus Parcubacteria bacterium]|nr:MAG: hypothetical protein D6833_11970 [Candidatus Parcubacteria bacterium]
MRLDALSGLRSTSIVVSSLRNINQQVIQYSKDKGIPYEFKDADQLLKDFFEDVDRLLQEVKRR